MSAETMESSTRVSRGPLKGDAGAVFANCSSSEYSGGGSYEN